MTPSPRLALLFLAAGLAGCMQRPPNNTTAEGQAFYACDRAALDQTADTRDLIPQVWNRERIRRECLASDQIPPLPGIKYVQAPVAQGVPQAAPQPAAQPPAQPSAPAIPPPPTMLNQGPAPSNQVPAVPDSQNYQPSSLIQPPPPS
jgi:hypothetical protein